MRPMLSNSREISDAHWTTASVPIQGWVVLYQETNENSPTIGTKFKYFQLFEQF